MTAPPRPADRDPTPPDPAPLATVRPRRRSLTWLIPLAALALVGLLLGAHLARARGPTITIRFDDAAGLTPGAQIVHRGMTVGIVRDVRPTDALDAALVTAELVPEARSLAAEGAAFWIVRPEVSLQRVAGLETLIGPRYVAARPGPPGAPPADAFVGLTSPPRLDPPEPGALRITLRAPRLGSLAPGSPVLYREIPVGAIRETRLADDATSVLITAEIEARFVPLVRQHSRFWRVSGIGVDFGLFRGLSVRAESIDQFISGAVSFATPNRLSEPAPPGHVFDVADQPDNDWLSWAPAIELARPAPRTP